MKVRPRIKFKPLKLNELRIISIDEDAIAELLLENLLDNKGKYFNLPDISENSTCVMKWDTKHNLLTYAVMPIDYLLEGYDLNPDFIRNIGLTTNSLFKSDLYKTFVVTQEMLIHKT